MARPRKQRPSCKECGVNTELDQVFCSRRCAAVFRCRTLTPEARMVWSERFKRSWTAERRQEQSARMKARWRTIEWRALHEASTPLRLERSFKRYYEYLDRFGRLHTFKSGDHFERGVAAWLDRQELTWQYEPHALLLPDGRRYWPDFWIEEWKSYLEVKGCPNGLDKVQGACEAGYPVLLVQDGNDVLKKMDQLFRKEAKTK